MTAGASSPAGTTLRGAALARQGDTGCEVQPMVEAFESLPVVAAALAMALVRVYVL
jgi:hypothetical protein